MPCLTISTLVVISLTKCSTCTRLFISRKSTRRCPPPAGPPPFPRRETPPRARRRRRSCRSARAAPRRRSTRRRRLLDELLVAALDRAVALAETDRVAVRVGEDLDLDVARVGQVALEVDRRIGEELLALAGGALERRLQLGRLQRDAKALAAAAARRLDRDRVADVGVDDLARGVDVRDRLDGPGHDRHAGGLHELACSRLGAHRVDRARRRPDEHDARLLTGAREGGVLGEKPYPGCTASAPERRTTSSTRSTLR